MLLPITSQENIMSSHQMIMQSLENNRNEKIITKLGFKNGIHQHLVSYSPDLDFWWLLNQPMENFWLNAFGVNRPRENKNTDTIVQTNYPYEGIYNRVASKIARDNDGNIFLLHDGSIRGGKPGFNRTNFWLLYNGDEDTVFGSHKRFAIVGQINSSNFINQVSEFVREVAMIKNLIDRGFRPSTSRNQDNHNLPPPTPTFNSEFFGERRYEITNTTVVAVVNHGRIVEALNDRLGALGFRTANNQNIDLFTHANNLNEEFLFEVKTSINTQSVYTAVGQLMLHSVAQSINVKKVFVAPAGLNSNLLNDLAALNIHVVTFEWENDFPVFSGLEDLF